jgi:hypothetical protein
MSISASSIVTATGVNSASKCKMPYTKMVMGLMIIGGFMKVGILFKTE